MEVPFKPLKKEIVHNFISKSKVEAAGATNRQFWHVQKRPLSNIFSSSISMALEDSSNINDTL